MAHTIHDIRILAVKALFMMIYQHLQLRLTLISEFQEAKFVRVKCKKYVKWFVDCRSQVFLEKR